ncbi:MAG: PKD domain-containing protein [Nanobdellota archaeon]
MKYITLLAVFMSLFILVGGMGSAFSINSPIDQAVQGVSSIVGFVSGIFGPSNPTPVAVTAQATVEPTPIPPNFATARISMPQSVLVGEDVTISGSNSTGAYHSAIDSYHWTIDGSQYSGEVLNLSFQQTGVYDVELLVVDDYGKSDTQTKQLTVATPSQLSIDVPSSALVGSTVQFFNSVQTSAGVSIVSYQWTITTPAGTVLDTQTGSVYTGSFDQTGNLQVTLSATTSTGQVMTASDSISIVEQDVDISDFSPEDGLKLMSYTVYGSDVETITADEFFVVNADVKNYIDQDLDGVRLIFSIPELGLKYKSGGISLDAGERKTISIQRMAPYDIQPGIYYPRFTLSDDEIRRVKYGYLEVIEEN